MLDLLQQPPAVGRSPGLRVGTAWVDALPRPPPDLSEDTMITYQLDENLRVEELEPFFSEWPAPPGRERRKALIEGSDVVVTARENGQLVGLLTGITDGALHALVTILTVLPSHRRRGVGTDLLKRALDQLGPIYDVTLISDAKRAPFYEPHGFRPGFSMNRRDLAATADP